MECVERTADADATKGIAINPRLVESQTPVAALAEAAAGASMLVLGVHRRHWMDGTIGSTAKACLKHASCAVVVVPETAAEFSALGADAFASSRGSRPMGDERRTALSLEPTCHRPQRTLSGEASG
jgi:hypothetical protein